MEGTSRQPLPLEKTAPVSDWRSRVTPDIRRWLIDMIIETSRQCVPMSLPVFIHAQEKLAIQFEEMIYNAATSQPDYLQQISSKMLSLETHFQNHLAINHLASVLSQNPVHPVEKGTMLSGASVLNQNPAHPVEKGTMLPGVSILNRNPAHPVEKGTILPGVSVLNQNPALPEDPSPPPCNCYLKVQQRMNEMTKIQIQGPSSARKLKRFRTCPKCGWESCCCKFWSKEIMNRSPLDEESQAMDVPKKPKRGAHNQYQHRN